MRLDCDILSQISIPPPPKVGSKNGKLEATTKNENMKQTENWYRKRAKDNNSSIQNIVEKFVFLLTDSLCLIEGRGLIL